MGSHRRERDDQRRAEDIEVGSDGAHYKDDREHNHYYNMPPWGRTETYGSGAETHGELTTTTATMGCRSWRT